MKSVELKQHSLSDGLAANTDINRTANVDPPSSILTLLAMGSDFTQAAHSLEIAEHLQMSPTSRNDRALVMA